jgi:hypothetical protein
MNPLKATLVVIPLLAGNANAQVQVLNKCVASSGAVSWQSAPCGQGSRLMRRVAYTPEEPVAVPAPVPVRVGSTSRPRAASGRRFLPGRSRRPKPDACARARAHREATLERVGLKRNFDLLSKLDAEVRRACRY